MGICMSYSKTQRQEMVSRCRARKRYIKQLVQARQDLSVAQSVYLRSLCSAGAALVQFATGESSLHLHRNPFPPPPPTPPHPPPLSPITADAWTNSASSTTTTTTTISSSSSATPPPPPPPPPAASTWDFWDPFGPSSVGTQFAAEEEVVAGGGASPAVVSVAASVAAPASVVSGFAKEGEEEVVVVVRKGKGKEVVEIIREVDEYFVKAAESGSFVSGVLELPIFSDLPDSTGKVYHYGRNFSLNPMLGFVKLKEDMVMGDNKVGVGVVDGSNVNIINGRSSHCSTLKRLYAWEKKLFLEVKNAEKLKMEHERKVEQLRKLEVKRMDYVKIDKSKKEVEKLESQMEVASQAISSTSAEIVKLRENEVYPQLLDLVKGFMCMWRSMYECHQVQMHIVDQLKLIDPIPSTEPTSEIHRQTTLQLESELQRWHQSFLDLVKAHRDYIRALTGWLRLSLFEFNKNPPTRSIQDSFIYSLCEEWQLSVDRAPDKVAAEGIKTLLNVVHAVVVQQAEEHKQEKRLEAANKELEKKAAELRALEVKHGPNYSTTGLDPGNKRGPVVEKRMKVETLKAKADEEKAKHEKAVRLTRSTALNNLQMGLPHVFQAITGFSSVCMQGFESVYNQAKSVERQEQGGVKRLIMG